MLSLLIFMVLWEAVIVINNENWKKNCQGSCFVWWVDKKWVSFTVRIQEIAIEFVGKSRNKDMVKITFLNLQFCFE